MKGKSVLFSLSFATLGLLLTQNALAQDQNATPSVCQSQAVQGSWIKDAATLRQACALARVACQSKVGSTTPTGDDTPAISRCVADDMRRNFPDAEREVADYEQAQQQQAADLQRAQQDRMAQLRVNCVPGQMVRVNARARLRKEESAGNMLAETLYSMPVGQIAQVSGLDPDGNECIVAVRVGSETLYGSPALTDIEPLSPSDVARQQQRPVTRQCRRSGWMTVCVNVRN